jgi:hypothetical protein
MALAGWLVIVEAVGAIISLAIKTWGTPTDEIRAKLIASCTLPVPGPTDEILATIDAEIARSTATTIKFPVAKDVTP